VSGGPRPRSSPRGWGRTSALLALLVAGPAAAGTSHALVIGNDVGLVDEPSLEFAEADARQLARTLEEVGAVSPGQVQLLLGARLPTVVEALERLGTRLERDDQVLVFFSGHGSNRGAHVSGEVWSWPDVRQQLERLPARLVVGFFDACMSGALLTPKGLIRGAPLKLSLAPLGPSGRFLVSSSGANELSYESTLLQSSPFALALRSGLRGAADGNGDGRITLSELYAFLYGHTLAATLASPTGPQHPAHISELHGAGEVTLATRSGQARLKCLAGTELHVASVTLASTDIRLDTQRFSRTARTPALAKGTAGSSSHWLEAGVGGLGSMQERPAPFGVLRYRWLTGELALHAQLVMTSGTLLPLAGFGARFPWWQTLGTRLEVGVAQGPRLRLQPSARGGSAAAGAVGPYAQLDAAMWGCQRSPPTKPHSPPSPRARSRSSSRFRGQAPRARESPWGTTTASSVTASARDSGSSSRCALTSASRCGHSPSSVERGARLGGTSGADSSSSDSRSSSSTSCGCMGGAACSSSTRCAERRLAGSRWAAAGSSASSSSWPVAPPSSSRWAAMEAVPPPERPSWRESTCTSDPPDAPGAAQTAGGCDAVAAAAEGASGPVRRQPLGSRTAARASALHGAPPQNVIIAPVSRPRARRTGLLARPTSTLCSVCSVWYMKPSTTRLTLGRGLNSYPSRAAVL
jgi:Caspase domain